MTAPDAVLRELAEDVADIALNAVRADSFPQEGVDIMVAEITAKMQSALAPLLARAAADREALAGLEALVDEAADVVDDVVIVFSEKHALVRAARIDRWKAVAARLRAAVVAP